MGNAVKTAVQPKPTHRAKMTKVVTPRPLATVNAATALPDLAANDVSQSPSGDEHLVARAQAGDSRAFEMLVMKYQNRVTHLAARMVGEMDAPDVAQMAFIKAWRALKSFESRSQFYTWLYRITTNCAKNHLVTRSRRPSNQDIDIADAEEFGHSHHLSDIANPERLLLTEELKAKILAGFDKLAPILRQAITLREIDGLSYDEIAAVMKCPVGTVRSRIFRAREELDLVIAPLMA
jgi:RNA polymerase sigma-70 factor (ECF subfamily)